MKHKYTNHLINETSPYLLQHAHNPVDWHPWGDEALEKARKEDKLLLISIGYSACHWCHVMERESFEDEEVAKIMNEKYVCIKVDREERPDIDQIYMGAIQLQKQSGGWPLNFFALPDGKPFTGGTYFPKNQWLEILGKVDDEYSNNRQKVIEYSNNLAMGVQQSELLSLNTEPPIFERTILDEMVSKWKEGFDQEEGGRKTSRNKFPIPNNYQFLLRYYHFSKDKKVLDHVNLTLEKMAFGGIYDQLGGGFSRYSTDRYWKVPHFEKMLYDNAQMISLYSEAYQATKNDLYKKIVYETLEYIEREMTDESGAFYSALDADSEGEEGKFYIWEKDTLQQLLKEDYELFADYYNVNNIGLWEHGNYILLRKKQDEEIAKKHNISLEELQKHLSKSKEKLLEVRSKRIRPGLDDKSLTSWNALMLKGFVDAYMVFGEEKFLQTALKNAHHLIKTQRRDDGGLWHSYKKGRSTINSYLEDYCFTIESLISLYQATFDEQWLHTAKELADYTIEHFYNEENGMFWFTSNVDKPLAARKMEISDNVIPASNSSMANALFLLGHYFDNTEYLKVSQTMLNNIKNYMSSYGSGYSNWGLLMLNHLMPFYEIAISGKNAHQRRQEFNLTYIPNKMYVGNVADSQLPLLENKFVDGKTMIYVCLNKVCQLPVTETNQALEQIK
ncbi:MAG: thioredoxin domain-containing protein [Flavobacteriales bacterium]|nr:MAG: thioredoxin domain-containing protein [Flavobacteriales bacterium]